MKKILIALSLAVAFSSCDDMFEPAIENIEGIDKMYSNPDFAYGVLITSYQHLPYETSTDLASDDCVSNDSNNGARKVAAGQWSASNNPFEWWRSHRSCIQATNLFLANVDQVEWAPDPALATMLRDRMCGEAYALRGMHIMAILRNHGGFDESGKLLGLPLLLEPEDMNSNFNLPRDSYADCVEQAYADFEKALELLPLDYGAHTEVPQKYQDLGVTEVDVYDRVVGVNMSGLISGRIVETFRSQLALLAASPRYSEQSGVTYKEAADYAGAVLNRIGGVDGMDPNGGTWFTNTVEIDGLTSGANPAEIIWRSSTGDSNYNEVDNYPPSIFGNGRINPTQNLVDAFPMKNGYPISDKTNSNYDEANLYADRDPRLAKYIIFNGETQGTSNTQIFTGVDGATLDALNRENGKSTRTGYYMRKHTRPDVTLSSTSSTTKRHYSARIRYTEIFLNYAEAANEAYGPTTPADGLSFSAYDVVKALRQRAGLDAADPYLESIKGDKEAMRELIRNERRIELCFEGFRFWDLRRWNVELSKLNETARGISISESGASFMDVDARLFNDFMYSGPIPYSEVLKYSNLQQNKGWK